MAFHEAVMGTAVSAGGCLFALYRITQLAEYNRKQVRFPQVLQVSNASCAVLLKERRINVIMLNENLSSW